MITEVVVLGVLDCDKLLMFLIHRRRYRVNVLPGHHEVVLTSLGRVWMVHPLIKLVLDLPFFLLANLPDPFKHILGVSQTLPSHLLLGEVRTRLHGQVLP